MKAEYLQKMDRIAAAAGTRDPEAVLEYMGWIYVDPGTAVEGFLTRRKGFTYYGVSRLLEDKKFAFGVMHEGFHGVCGHLESPGFLSGSGAHMETGSFAAAKRVADTEREANIGAADFIVDTELVLQLLGYERTDVRAYRKSVASFEQTLRDYSAHLDLVAGRPGMRERVRHMEAYRSELEGMYRRLQEQARELTASGCCTDKAVIAAHCGVPGYILDYKLEALRVRGYDVSMVELPNFETVFKNWN